MVIEGEHIIRYFDLPRGRALPIEMAMKLAKVEYCKESPINFQEWPAVKADPTKSPFGRLPVVVLPGGQPMCQLVAILEYLAKPAGLLYGDVLQDARVMELAYAMDDMFSPWVAVVTSDTTRDEKREAWKMLISQKYPELMKYIDASIARTSKGIYAVGDKLTLADIVLLHVETFLCSKYWSKHVPATLFDEYENIQKVLKNVRAHPVIAEVLAANIEE
eukprot:Lankesteria_metandrocarpae@DN3264_c0_g1_i1.p1